MQTPNVFLRSYRELKSIRTLCATALLLAAKIAVGVLVTVPLTEDLRISFGFLFSGAIGMLFGPVVGGLAGIVSDLVTFMFRPMGAYFPGFTLSACLSGMLYGLAFYGVTFSALTKGKLWLRLIAAQVANNLLINLILNTLWNAMLIGKGFFVLLPARFLKNVLLLPIEIPLLFALLLIVERIWARLPRER